MNDIIQSINQLSSIKKTIAMRKSFTRVFGIFILSMIMTLHGMATPTLATTNLLNIKKTDKFVLTSDKAVTPGTGVVRLLDASNNPLKTYQASSSNVVISNVKNGSGLYEITVDFSAYLEEEKAYKLEVDADFVKDATGSNAALAAAAVQVGDWTKPVLKSTSPFLPKNGETVNVQLNQVLEVTFNEDVKLAAGAKVHIYTDNGTAYGNLFETVSGGAGLTVKAGDSKTIQISATKTFVQLTKYYVTIPKGSVVDAADVFGNDNMNKFDGWLNETTWAFTTRDNTIAAFTKKVADNIAKDQFDVFMQLDKAGKAYVMAVPKNAGVPTVPGDFTAGNGMISKSVATANTDFYVTLTQYYNGTTAVALAEGVEYDVYAYTENTQVAPNVMSPAQKLFTVKTIDVTRPTATLNPLDGAVDVKLDDFKYKGAYYLRMKLSETIKKGTGDITIYKWDNNSPNHTLVKTVPVSDCMVSLISTKTQNDSLYIPVPVATWESAQTYFVKYDEGIVVDLSNNKILPIVTTEAWKFDVIDYKAPTYTFASVQTATTAANQFVDLVFDFNEVLYSDAVGTVMTAGTGGTFASTLTIKQGTTAVAPTAIVLSATDKFTVTIPVSSAKVYTVNIDTKLVFDLKGNKGTTVDAYTVTVKDYQPPVVTFTPDLNTTLAGYQIGKTDNFVIKFDEAVYKGSDGSAIDDAYVAAHVILRKGTNNSGAFVSATYSVAPDAKSFIINPVNDFTAVNDPYYVELGAGTVKDASGNAIAFSSAQYYVDDFQKPTAQFKYGAGAGTAFSSALVNPSSINAGQTFVEFSEGVMKLDGTTNFVNGSNAAMYINFKENNENVVYAAVWDLTGALPRIIITYAFKNSTDYTISIGKSLLDGNKNSFDGASVSFSTFSNLAPSVSSKDPDANVTAIALNKAITVTFNEAIFLSAGSVSVTTENADGSNAPSAVGGISLSKSGSVLTIAHANFTSDQKITVTVNGDVVKNTATISNAAVAPWSFYTIDQIAPTYVEANCIPKVDAAAQTIDVADVLKLKLSEKVNLKTGTIYIRRNSDGVAVQTLTEANCKLDNTNTLLTITPVAELAYGVAYYVEITPGLVEDVEGNKFAGFVGNTVAPVWDFTTNANAGAFTVSLTGSSPANNQDKVSAGLSTISVKFNHQIKANSLSSVNKIKLEKTVGATTTTVWEDAATHTRFSTTADVLNINTLNDIVANATYTLTINAGVVDDIYNYPGGNAAAVITFYTFDNNGPKVIDFTPAASTTPTAAVNSNVVIKWDEAPLSSTGAAIEASTIKGTSTANALVTVGGDHAYTAYISDNGLTWTLVMDAPFAEKTTYTVVVKQTSVKDASNNTQAADKTWSFMTEDKTIAAPKNFVEVANTTGTQIDFTVEFNEEGTVYYLVRPKADGAANANDIIAADKKIAYSSAVVTWTASATQNAKNLTSSVEYTFWFVAKDKVGNVSTVYSVNKTTYDNIKPIATIVSPANEATQQADDVDLVLSFNEEVKVGTAGAVIIRELATDIIVRSIDITNPGTAIPAAAVTVDGAKTKVTIDFGGNLASQTAYYIEVVGGSITDLNGNPMDKIVGSDKWSFTVKDTDAPLLVATTPDYKKTVAQGLPEIAKGTTLTMEFNESVKAGNGALVVYYKSTVGSVVAGEEFEVVNVDQMDFSVDKKVSFTLVNIPVEQTDFYVNIPTGIIKDMANNSFAGGLSAGGSLGTTVDPIFDFIILDQTPPALATAKVQKDITTATWVNAVNATGIDIGTNIEVTFNEAIFKSPDGTAFTSTTIDNIVTLKNAAGTVIELNATNTVFDGVSKITIDPKNALASETVYTVTISPVVDNRKNVNGETTFSFTTKDMTPPVATISPKDPVISSKNGVVTVQFSEPVYDEVILSTNEGNNVVFAIQNENIPSFFTYQRVTSKTDMTPIGAATAFTGTYDATNYVITLTPKSTAIPLVSEGWYQVVLLQVGGKGVVMDKAANGNAVTSAVFQVEDHVKPIANSYLPAGPALSTATMSITFDTPVTYGSGNIYVRNYVNGDVMEVIPVSSSTVSFNSTNKVATITHAPFAANMNFFVTADAGTFTDKSTNLNPWVGIATSAINTWKFSTADGVKPVVQVNGLKPANGETNVPVGTDLEITFSKQVFAGAVGKRVIIYNEDWTPFEAIDVTSANITFKAFTDPVYETNRIMVVNPTSNLASKSKYYVRIEDGALVDAANNQYDGLLDLSWSFTTEDNTAPSKLTLDPATGDSGVSVKPTLTITFDRNIEANSAGKILIYKEEGPSQLGTLIESIISTDATKVEVINDKAVITPSVTLEYNTNYYVIIELGAFTNTSTSKLPFAGITTTQGWKFTTKIDNDKPTLVSVSPTTTGLKPADVKLEITLSEDVQAGTGNIVIYNAADDQMVESIAIGSATIAGAKVTATPTGLAEQMSYYVKVDAGAITDKAATPNAYAGIEDKTTWAFSTGDFTAPTMVSVAPTATTLTANHPDLVLTVNEAVKLTTAGGSVTITKVGATVASVTVPLTAAMISADGKVITVTYTSAAGGLDKNTDYYVTVPAGALEDNAGNDFAGVTDATAWTFKTGADFATGNDPVIGSLEFKVYPNPFVNELKVENASELSRIIITSMTGQKVKEIVNPTSTIQTNELRSGVYFISMFKDDVAVKTERIVKR